jgi:hypothetical protein
LEDGLCQELIGIGLLASSLEQRLEREGHAAGAEAGQISGLLRAAAAHARGLADRLQRQMPASPLPASLPSPN